MLRPARLASFSLAVFFLSVLWAGPALAEETNTVSGAVVSPPVIQVRDFPLPEKASLCGESLPMDDAYVWEMLDRELTIVAWDRPQVLMWLKRSGRYFPHIEKRLAEEGLPDDLKYLAVAESSLLPYIRSGVGALGTWQFMPFTAKRHGLRSGDDFDDRLNFERSTEAAIAYLKTLKGQFGSWLLALAAYNCGEGCVGKEINEQGERNYTNLDLPFETERFVFRIAAIKIIMENPAAYGYEISPERIYSPLAVDRVAVDLSKDLHMTEAAKAIGTTYKKLRELNPEIRSRSLPAGRYDIVVPEGMGAAMKSFLQGKASESAKTVRRAAPGDYYVVRSGDNLTQIAQRTGVPLSTLRALNNIKGSHIEIGQKLRLK